MATHRVLILEDNPGQADQLRAYISRYSEERATGFQITWMKSAVEFVGDQIDVDVVFMDIDLPGINGIEAARYLRAYSQDTQLVFVTNLARYAVKGYEVDALDFIVKPVHYVNIALTLDKALRVLERNKGKVLSVPTRDGIRIIPASDLMYADVLDHDLTCHLSDGRVITIRKTLGWLERELEKQPFVRISKSCLANMRHVQSVSGSEMSVSDGATIYISRGMRQAVLQALANYYGGN